MRTTAARPAGTGHRRSSPEYRFGGSRACATDRASRPSGPPPIVTVFRSADNELHHGWCGRTLEYLGRRERQELDFYCTQCFEHVSVPECTLTRIPVSVPARTTGRLVPRATVGDRPRRSGPALESFGERRAAA